MCIRPDIENDKKNDSGHNRVRGAKAANKDIRPVIIPGCYENQHLQGLETLSLQQSFPYVNVNVSLMISSAD